MSGMPYEPIVQLSTPISRLAVMEGRTLAIATYNSKLNDDFEIATDDPEQRREIEEGMARAESRIQSDMDPVRAAASMDTDEVVCFDELRAWLCCLTEAAWQSAGYRRTKNPRIWSLHDLCRIGGLEPGASTVALKGDDGLQAPTPGRWRAVVPGAYEVQPGQTIGHIQQGDRLVTIAAPRDFRGFVRPVMDDEWVQCGDTLVHRVEALGVDDVGGTEATEQDGLPEGVTPVVAETDGTIYLSPDPASPSFVGLEQHIQGQTTVALIEVMKTFTPVRNEYAGQVVRVLVEDGEAVTAGQVLMWLRQ